MLGVPQRPRTELIEPGLHRGSGVIKSAQTKQASNPNLLAARSLNMQRIELARRRRPAQAHFKVASPLGNVRGIGQNCRFGLIGDGGSTLQRLAARFEHEMRQ